VPPVLEPATFERLAPTQSRDTTLMLVEPGARQEVLAVGALPVDPPSTVTIVIGPEGGWTAEELQIGSAASRLITLGERTLRADAMALVAMTALFTRWNEF
jgi:RsmE family RNA methyltransferase